MHLFPQIVIVIIIFSVKIKQKYSFALFYLVQAVNKW